MTTPEEESTADARFRAVARAWLEANARRRSGDDRDWSGFHFSGDPSPEADAEHVRRCQEWQFWQQQFLGQWGVRIGGGTDQVQRNVIGERVLGLPAEPRPDKSVPFRELVGS